MAQVIQVEQRRRGVFGWIFLGLFWAYNLLMVIWLFSGLAEIGETSTQLSTDAERAGAAIGTAIGVSMVLGIWMSGAVILGLFVLLTRGRKTIITTETKP